MSEYVGGGDNSSTYITKLFMSGYAKWQVNWSQVSFGTGTSKLVISPMTATGYNATINSSGAFGAGIPIISGETKNAADMKKIVSKGTPVCSITYTPVGGGDTAVLSLWQCV